MLRLLNSRVAARRVSTITRQLIPRAASPVLAKNTAASRFLATAAPVSNKLHTAETAAASARPAAANNATTKESNQALLIFELVFDKLEKKYGRDALHFPREILWLGGAPGAGKGTNTEFIMRERGIDAPPIVISSLLNTPAMKKIKDNGGLVGDAEVVELLLEELLKPVYKHGVIVDGFPRTRIQVDIARMLYDRMHKLREEYCKTPLAKVFRKPSFRIVMLFVDEQTSVDRQLARGRAVVAHNEKVRATGKGKLQEERKTDLDVDFCRKRFQVFKEQTFSSLDSLRNLFHYHFINAEGSITAVEANINKELAYQSSLELAPETFEVISQLPLAHDVTLHARQKLVRRLDDYQAQKPELFGQVVKLIETDFLPLIKRHAISGHVKIRSTDPLFNEPDALSMLLDVFAERGFDCYFESDHFEVPVSFKGDNIVSQTRPVHKFYITWQKGWKRTTADPISHG